MAGLLTAGGVRLTFRVRDEAGTIANFRAQDGILQRAARRRVREAGRVWLEIVRRTVAVDTGRMRRLVKVVYSQSGLVFEGGWLASEFEAEGEEFYPPYVEVGTFRQRAQPSIVPAWLIVQGRLRDGLAADMRRAAVRAG